MLGLMQQQPLMISSLLQFAARHHGDAEIVSNTVEGGRHRYTYRDAERRARRLARALDGLGIRQGDRVGTLAWNGYRHLELYFAVPGMGAVLHTVNPRLFEDQILYIVDDAEDQVLFADITFLPLVETVLRQLRRRPRALVVLSDREHLPEVSLPPGVALHAYEDLLAAAPDDYTWPELDEELASGLCYTSGTTGHPKGVLYSHRSTVLQALASSLPDVFGLRAVDRVLPVVAMFHVNAWSIPYCRDHGGRRPGPRRRQDGWREPVRADRERACHLRRRRADGLARPCPAPACLGRPRRWPRAALRRWRGLPSGFARGAARRIRRRGRPRLGHDGDDGSRRLQPPQAGRRRPGGAGRHRR